jgi:hypothetical protein
MRSTGMKRRITRRITRERRMTYGMMEEGARQVRKRVTRWRTIIVIHR